MILWLYFLPIVKTFASEDCDKNFWSLIDNPGPSSTKKNKYLLDKLNNFFESRHKISSLKGAKINAQGLIKFPEGRQNIQLSGDNEASTIQIYGYPYHYRGQIYVDYLFLKKGNLRNPDQHRNILRTALLNELIAAKTSREFIAEMPVLIPLRLSAKVPGDRYEMGWVLKDLGDKLIVRQLSGHKKIIAKEIIERHNFSPVVSAIVELASFFEAGHRGRIIFLSDQNGVSVLGIHITRLKEDTDFFDSETLKELNKLVQNNYSLIYEPLTRNFVAAVLRVESPYLNFFVNKLDLPRQPVMFITKRVDTHTIVHESRHLEDYKAQVHVKLKEKIDQIFSGKDQLTTKEFRLIESFILELRAYNDHIEVVYNDAKRMDSYNQFDSFLGHRTEVPYRTYKSRITETIISHVQLYAESTNELLEKLQNNDHQKYEQLIAVLFEFTRKETPAFKIEKVLPILGQ